MKTIIYKTLATILLAVFMQTGLRAVHGNEIVNYTSPSISLNKGGDTTVTKIKAKKAHKAKRVKSAKACKPAKANKTYACNGTSNTDQIVISRKGSKVKTFFLNIRPFSAGNAVGNLEIEYNGEIHVTDDDRGIKSISKGGYLYVTKSSFGNTRKIEIEGKTDGTVVRKYFEGRKEIPYDKEGKEFLADILPIVIRSTGIDAENRVARIWKTTGIEGFIAEVSKIESNNVKRTYFQYLWGNHKLNKEENIRAIDAMAIKIISNSNRGILFRKIDELFMQDTELSEAFFRNVTKLSSNSERGYILRHTIKNNELNTEQQEQLFKSAGRMSSNSERGSVFRKIEVVDFSKLSTVEAYFTNVGRMESSSERGSVLRNRLDKQKLNKKAMMGLLYCTQKIPSNSERGSILRKAIDQIDDESELMEIFFATVAKMESNSERGVVLRKLAKKQPLKPETYVGILNTSKKLSSNSEKTNVITTVCKMMPKDNETVTEAYIAAVKSITSNSDYRYAMECLDK